MARDTQWEQTFPEDRRRTRTLAGCHIGAGDNSEKWRGGRVPWSLSIGLRTEDAEKLRRVLGVGAVSGAHFTIASHAANHEEAELQAEDMARRVASALSGI